MFRSYLWLAIAISGVAHALPGHDNSSICAQPATTVELIKCAQVRAPSAARAVIFNEGLATLPAKEAQFSNPEFEVESIQGKGKSEMEISITQSLDIGGKTRARLKTAQAQRSESLVDIKLEQSSIVNEAMTKLHRLRQIKIERGLLTSIENVLKKSLTQMRNRPVLSPEQRGSQTVVQMAHADNRIKQNELLEEERSIEKFFLIATGQSLETVRKLLPAMPTEFPPIDGAKAVEGPQTLKALAMQEVALSELEMARAESWPELKLAPIFRREKEAGAVENAYGIKLSIDLPFFNEAKKVHASSNLIRAQKIVQLTQLESAYERENWLQTYRQSMEALKQVPGAEELQNMHRRTEEMEKKGLISSSLLIESLRQRMEIIQGRHGLELRAIGALLNIYRNDGRNFEELL